MKARSHPALNFEISHNKPSRYESVYDLHNCIFMHMKIYAYIYYSVCLWFPKMNQNFFFLLYQYRRPITHPPTQDNTNGEHWKFLPVTYRPMLYFIVLEIWAALKDQHFTVLDLLRPNFLNVYWYRCCMVYGGICSNKPIVKLEYSKPKKMHGLHPIQRTP